MSAGLEAWQNPTVIDRCAQVHYRAEMEFHNFPHALRVGEIATVRAAEAMAHGVPIEYDVVKPASSYHDAGVHLQPGVDHPFFLREDYSSQIGRRELRQLGMPEPLVADTSHAIRSTSHTVPCETATARCIRQADLIAGGILSSPLVFLNGTYRLYLESKRLEDQQPAESADRGRLIEELVEFGGANHAILLTYLDTDLSLGNHDRDARGRNFNKQAMGNVALLAPSRLGDVLTANLEAIIATRTA